MIFLKINLGKKNVAYIKVFIEMLKVEGISKHFGGVKAVNNVSFHVKENEIHGLIGPNGAGKTTMINLISGLLKPNAGKIILDGYEIQDLPAEQRAKNGVARTFQNLRLFENMTVATNIKVAAFSRFNNPTDKSDHDFDLITDAIKTFQLEQFMDKYPSELAYGYMRRLEIVRALALRPKLLMLDEPAAGMNNEETEELFSNLLWLRNRHPCSIILIEHDLKFIMQASENLTVMNMGELLATGDPKKVTTNQDVISAYLGH